MKVLIIDNYDSFTFNLLHIVEQYAANVVVVRNDKLDIDYIAGFDSLIISPGPGLPHEAGNICEVINAFAGKMPILGICLGMQAMAVAFGGKLLNLKKVYHGKKMNIQVIEEHKIFGGLPKNIQVGRYHSWVIDKRTLPANFIITSVDDEGNPMSIKHKVHSLHGLQFHPESIMTEHGNTMLKNWIKDV